MSATIQGSICVTGVTGFLGSWVVEMALREGLTVRGTCRDVQKASFLMNLDGADERLKLFGGCDLGSVGSFNDAIEGCTTVIHTASPFFLVSDDEKGMENLVRPAVEGTKNVLETCKILGVKRVVLTSSTAAVYVVYGSKGKDYTFTEEDWSDEKTLLEKKNYYSLSKTRAEKLAWDISKMEGCPFKLCVMNPCLIFGPMLPGQTHLNTSCMVILRFVTGDVKEIKRECMNIVDVRDVARAHVLAALQPEDWKGWGNRFLLVANETSPMTRDIVDILRSSPRLSDEQKSQLATQESEEIPLPVMGVIPPYQTKFDLKKSLSPNSEGGLGLEKYIGTEEMVNGSVKSLLENGFDAMHHYTLTQ